MLERVPDAQCLVEDLMFVWLSQPSTYQLVESLVDDAVAGRPLPAPASPCSMPSPLFSPLAGHSKGFLGQLRSPPRSPNSGAARNSPRSPLGAFSPGSKLADLGCDDGKENRKELNRTDGTRGWQPPLQQARRHQPREEAVAAAAAAAVAMERARVPKFFFPGEGGRGRGKRRPEDTLSRRRTEFEERFNKDDNPNGLALDEFVPLTREICGFPSFFAAPLFRRIRALSCAWSGGDAAEAKAMPKGATGAVGTSAKAAKDQPLEDGPEGTAESKEPGSADAIGNAESKASSAKEVEHQDEAEGAGAAAVTNNARDGGTITCAEFCEWWAREMAPFDDMARFFRLLKQPDADVVEPADFEPFLDELIRSHPGLEFLANTPEFQEKYARTVVAQILYHVNSSGTGRITLREMRRSKLLSACHMVDEEEDINLVNHFFSYEHFYVLYCKFWELDSDHDFALSKEDLMRHGGHALTVAVVERIFAEVPRPFLGSLQPLRGLEDKLAPRGMMGFEDFVFFFLAEEDKTNAASLRYWFRCADIDGDGVLRSWEMRQFYAEQLHRMKCLGHEVVPFEDVLCQLHDCVQPVAPRPPSVTQFRPAIAGEFRLASPLAHALNDADIVHPERIKINGVLFNVLFNLNKFIAFEQRDPFLIRQQPVRRSVQEEPDLTDCPLNCHARIEDDPHASTHATVEPNVRMELVCAKPEFRLPHTFLF